MQAPAARHRTGTAALTVASHSGARGARAAARRAPPPPAAPPAGAPPAAAAPRPRHWLRAAAEAAAARAGAALLAAALLGAPPPAAAVTPEQLLFLEAWRAVDRAFYDKSFGGADGGSWFRAREDALKREPMATPAEARAAAARLLARLGDPYTRLLEPERYAALRAATAGDGLTGVGVEVSFDGAGRLAVVAPAPGGPAAAAGVAAGDAILAIDGAPVDAGASLYAAAAALQGAEGSRVVLTVAPAGGGPPREVPLVRARVRVEPVAAALCGAPLPAAGARAGVPRVGYLRIAAFSKATPDAARAATADLAARGARAYVLDLRRNGGGSFPAGVALARQWLPAGKDVVLVADADGVRDVYESDAAQLAAADPGARLVVLVDRGTASAAEVVAGALRDGGRAALAGETTFGKGLIQTLVPLSDGSAVAVSVARYLTPSGADINRVGIAPDVPLAPAQLAALPADAGGFCAAAAAPGAPALF